VTDKVIISGVCVSDKVFGFGEPVNIDFLVYIFYFYWSATEVVYETG
jgi:hypothetical protein